MRKHLFLQRFAPTALWVIGLLVMWESASWFLLHVLQVPLAQSKLPYIHELVLTVTDYGDTLFFEAWVTFTNAAIGFVFGAVAGSLLAIVMSTSKWVEQLTFPYAVASQMVPILGLAPIVYGIVRDEYVSRIIIAGYLTFFPVALNMLRGLVVQIH